jgi:hypothetical protein
VLVRKLLPLLCAVLRVPGGALRWRVALALVIANYALDRANSENRAFLATDGDGNRAKNHGEPPNMGKCSKVSIVVQRRLRRYSFFMRMSWASARATVILLTVLEQRCRMAAR